MPHNQPVVTESWNSYQECARCIQDFLREVTVRDSKCGFAKSAWVLRIAHRLKPLCGSTHELVHRSIERAQNHRRRQGSLSAVQTSRRVMEDLLGNGADKPTLRDNRQN